MRPHLIALVLLALAAPANASAGAGRETPTVFVFGDSFSDNGNAAVEFPGTFDFILRAPTAVPRFSNGPMWVDYLGEMLGRPITPAATGGTNYAIGGATISPENKYNFFPNDTGFAQVDSFLARYGRADPRAVHVVWLGGNDIDPPESYTEWNFHELELMVGKLYDAGARKFLVVNLFDLGKLPLFTEVSPDPVYAQQLDEMTALWNRLLLRLPAAFPRARMAIADVHHLKQLVDEHPRLFGFTDTTHGCFQDLTDGSVCPDPDTHWYWDYAHPTTRAHRLIATLLALDLVTSGELRVTDLRPLPLR